MLILNADEVRQVLPMKEAISARKDAYASLQRDGFCPASDTPTHPKQPSSPPLYASLCSHTRQRSAGDQICLFISNPAHGLAHIRAAVLAFNPETGQARQSIYSLAKTARSTRFWRRSQGRTQLEAKTQWL